MSSPLFLIMSTVKEISVFVDESGGFVPFNEDPATPYYILCMVFHDHSVLPQNTFGTVGKRALFSHLKFF